MKRLLSLLGVLMVGGSSTLSVVACNNSSGSNTNPDNEVNANVKSWAQQSSIIPKSIILGKTDNLNTNNILENGLKDNITNITNAGTSAGASFKDFTTAWGYNGTIDGITNKDFNDNSASTEDNKVQNISSILNSINTFIPLIQFSIQPAFQKSSNFYNFIMSKNGDKYTIAELLWIFLKNHLDILQKLPFIMPIFKQLLSILNPFFTNFAAFNPQQTLGKYYSNNIKDALFNNEGGWINNYSLYPETPIDSVALHSDILQGTNQDIFKTWDEVALFKAGADLNSTLKSSGTNLSDVFQKSLEFKDDKVTGFNEKNFIEGITTLYKNLTSSPLNIIPMIGVLVPIIKYQLGFKPTQDFKTITNKQDTSDPTNGILSITQLFKRINDILFTKQGFTNFFTTLFFPKSPGEYTESNFLTLDTTYQTSQNSGKAISEIIAPVETQITTDLGTIFDLYLEPFFKENNIQDIFNTVQNDIAGSNKKFDFNISYLKTIFDVLNSPAISGAFDKDQNYTMGPIATIFSQIKTDQDLQNNWEQIWLDAGMQKNNDAFVPDSILSILQPLATSDAFWTNIQNLFSDINDAAQDIIKSIVNKIKDKVSQELDFNNKTLWLIEDNSIKFHYDKNSNQSTLSYNLTYKGKTYIASVVVNTNAHDDLNNNSQQVWLKSLIGLD